MKKATTQPTSTNAAAANRSNSTAGNGLLQQQANASPQVLQAMQLQNMASTRIQRMHDSLLSLDDDEAEDLTSGWETNKQIAKDELEGVWDTETTTNVATGTTWLHGNEAAGLPRAGYALWLSNSPTIAETYAKPQTEAFVMQLSKTVKVAVLAPYEQLFGGDEKLFRYWPDIDGALTNHQNGDYELVLFDKNLVTNIVKRTVAQLKETYGNRIAYP